MTLEPPVAVPGAHAGAAGGSAAGTISCPRCHAPVAPDQDWCLQCGAAARTRLVPTPNWRAPIIALALVAVLAGAGLAVAFVALTDDNSAAPSTATSAPAVATEPTAAPPPTTPPTTPPPTATTPTVPTATTPTVPTATTPAQAKTTPKPRK